MTEKQIEKRIAASWEEVQRKCNDYVERTEAEAIAEYCKMADIRLVARATGLSQSTIQRRLTLFGMIQAACDTRAGHLEAGLRDTEKLIKKYGPTEADAEEFAPYVEHYEQLDYKPAVAERIARAEWAAEEAVEAGVIKEDTKKENERVHRILFPKEKQTTEQLQFDQHMANVRRAASFLENATVGFLKKESTRKTVAATHAKWFNQADHIRQLHQPSIR